MCSWLVIMRSWLVLAALCGSSCSLLVEQRVVQCATDDDCTKFAPHPYCVEGVCVESGLGPAGCTVKVPASDADFLRACTTSSCIPFDNCARLQWCDATAELPALLTRP
jgi:hypothetical protein